MKKLEDTLELKSGLRLKNRIVKAAMSENMAEAAHNPTKKFQTLYSTWSGSGAALLITGNVMVDARHLGEPHNVVFEENCSFRDELKAWSAAAKNNETHVYVQLNHPGKQVLKILNPQPVAPSSIAFEPPLGKYFNKARELRDSEIKEIIQRFAEAAKLAEDCNFSGVQIHGAHGYLVSQFLSPKSNQRQDKWGGSIENRMRFLLEICMAIRAATSSSFGLALKINSADFQKGGFSKEESLEVLRVVDKLELDFIEISGGSYESTVMMGNTKRQSTRKREAYFLDYVEKAKEFLITPLMLTGGFRTRAGMNEALGEGVDLIGLGRAFAIDPRVAHNILNKEDFQSPVSPKTTGVAVLDKMIPLEITWYTDQIHRLGLGKAVNPKRSVWMTVFKTFKELGVQALRPSSRAS